MRIDVTQDDIAAGIPGDPFCCPVAVAVGRQTGLGVCVCSALYRADRENGCWPGVPLPPGVREFARDFDAGRPVAPLSFELPDSFLGG